MFDSSAFGLTALQGLLLGEAPRSAIDDNDQTAEDPILGRIRQILEAGKRGEDIGRADLAALLRHVLLARNNYSRPEQLRISKDVGWAETEEWRRFGIHAVDLGNDLLLEAKPWRPEWLGPYAASNEDVFAEVFAGRDFRLSAETPIDPCVEEATGYKAYLCPGQREAVRSLFHMPAGSTLVVNLPTGSGKTLVAEMPTLLGGLNRGLTLFVVPTIALAIDQERRMRDLLSRTMAVEDIHELAWHAEMPASMKVAIKQRLRVGAQGILFASPEAVSGALLPALHEAADNGSLRYLVIDEAHMVTDWGDGFRPAFQVLAGVRRGLLRSCQGEAFRTVLMSATLSPHTLTTLKTLFGPPDNVLMIAAVHLRPEPRYWSCLSVSDSEKVERVVELVNHAPRPFLLYVTEPRDAERWLKILRDRGFDRVDCFHGKTSDSKREKIIEAWAADRLDGIVATSAFGVGMDKSDVRTIIHAGVPETLDRFYQEVGRGGRDGKASISVVVFTERDIGFARSLGRPRPLSEDNSFERWTTMFGTRRTVKGADLIAVDFTVVPPRLHQQTDFNEAWNMRTLILLERSGMIALDSLPPVVPERLTGESDTAYEAKCDKSWQTYFETVTLRTLDPAHLVRGHFDAETNNDRQRRVEAAKTTFGALEAVLNGTMEMASALAGLYRSDAPGSTVTVSKACRGCPCDPSDALQIYQIPLGIGIERIAPIDLSVWEDRFPWLSGTVTILYPREADDLEAQLEGALSALVGVFGLPEVSAPAAVWTQATWMARLHHEAPTRTLIARSIEEDQSQLANLPVPRASLLWPWGEERIPDALLFLDRPLHVLLAPKDVPSDHPFRRYADTATNVIHLDAFLKTATQ